MGRQRILGCKILLHGLQQQTSSPLAAIEAVSNELISKLDQSVFPLFMHPCSRRNTLPAQLHHRPIPKQKNVEPIDVSAQSDNCVAKTFTFSLWHSWICFSTSSSRLRINLITSFLSRSSFSASFSFPERDSMYPNKPWVLNEHVCFDVDLDTTHCKQSLLLFFVGTTLGPFNLQSLQLDFRFRH